MKEKMEKKYIKGRNSEFFKRNKKKLVSRFTAEFFKFFWSDLSQFIEKSFEYSFKKGMLSNVQSQGILSILPKGNKPREFLKN